MKRMCIDKGVHAQHYNMPGSSAAPGPSFWSNIQTIDLEHIISYLQTNLAHGRVATYLMTFR